MRKNKDFIGNRGSNHFFSISAANFSSEKGRETLSQVTNVSRKIRKVKHHWVGNVKFNHPFDTKSSRNIPTKRSSLPNIGATLPNSENLLN